MVYRRLKLPLRDVTGQLAKSSMRAGGDTACVGNKTVHDLERPDFGIVDLAVLFASELVLRSRQGGGTRSNSSLKGGNK